MRILLVAPNAQDKASAAPAAPGSGPPAGGAEDAAPVLDAVEATLRRFGHDVVRREAEDVVGGAAGTDCLVVALGADGTGVDVVAELRGLGVETPMIAVADAGADVATRVSALDYGADDCVGAEADPTEIEARINALLRRCAGMASSVVAVGPLTVNLTAARAIVAGRVVPLTDKEYLFLEKLAMRAGRVVSRSDLMDHIYVDQKPTGAVLDVYACTVRKKLAAAAEAAGEPLREGLIETEYGRGFALRAPMRAGAASAARERAAVAA